ncbi:MAG: POTRA domain-containing protein [Candidatus Korobacteraceae bacterium]
MEHEVLESLSAECFWPATKAEERAAEIIHRSFQTRGFFRSRVRDVELHLLDEAAEIKPAAVIATVQEGNLYRLAKVSFVEGAEEPSTVPISTMRAMFEIQDGEILNVEEIAKGLESLRKLFGEQGYINFTPVPDTIVDESTKTVALKIDLDKGIQFRISRIRFVGAPAVGEKLSELCPLKPGDIYNTAKFQQFFEQYRGLLPPDFRLDQHAYVEHNTADSTIEITVKICFPGFYCF